MTGQSTAAATPTQCRATWWRGCQWEARYDVVPPSFTEAIGSVTRLNGIIDPAEIIEAATKTIYVRDICTRCGAVKERE